MLSKKNLISNIFWISAGIITLLIRFWLSHHPEIVEQYYSRGIFIWIRKILDAVTWIAPIPLMYVFFGIFLILGIVKIIRLFRRKEKPPLKIRILNFFLSLFGFLGFLIAWFLVFWGYNYLRVPIEQQLGLQVPKLEVKALKTELITTTQELIDLRNAIPNATTKALDKTFIPQDFEAYTNAIVTQFLHQHNYPASGNANARFLHPKGILLHISTAGIYFPFVGESNIDAGLHTLSQPYVLAHELAHAYGFGAEGTCNFIAYLACKEANDPFIKYCGVLGYWRRLAGNYKFYNKTDYNEFRNCLPDGIIADLNAINRTLKQYPDIFPVARHATYDAYLKAQGIKEGIKSYARVVHLGIAWRKKMNE